MQPVVVVVIVISYRRFGTTYLPSSWFRTALFWVITQNSGNLLPTFRVNLSVPSGFRTALFWVVTQRVVVISYRRYGTTYRSHPQGRRLPPHLAAWLNLNFGTFWTVTVNKLFQDLTEVSVFIAIVSCSTIFTREVCDGNGRTLC